MTKILVLGGGPAGYVAAGRAAQLGAEVTRRGGARDRRHLPQPRLHPDQGDGGRRRAPARGAARRRVRRAGRRGRPRLRRLHGAQGRRHDAAARRRRAPAQGAQGAGGGRAGYARRPRPPGPRARRRPCRTAPCSRRAASSRATPSSSPAAPSRCAWASSTGRDPRVMTSDELLRIDAVPASLAIVGGGVIGCEFASVFNRLGSQVTVDRDARPAAARRGPARGPHAAAGVQEGRHRRAREDRRRGGGGRATPA